MLYRGRLNVVGEVLRGQADFVEMEHFPEDDVFDPDSHAQYYYHATAVLVEHSHFHYFHRAKGMPPGAALIEWPLANRSLAEGR